ncbi:MAG TPA: single-stranded-DNA-specific exonuclease RecJ [Candidatus Limnocylindrales bacterium]|nr:single-stranded-DNA-specific exonuclease RecJ [Candidatus Limnocylindrales bacterium]
MLEPRTRWRFPEPVEVDPGMLARAAELGLGPRLAEILVRRGIDTPAALSAFVGPAQASLNDPGLLPDAARFRDRIVAARDRGERVLVFGDFDADGVSGLAVLTLALRRLGIDVVPYVPSRLEEGHGLSLAGIEAAVAARASVIVTVDTGTSSADEVGLANGRGVDVLITDHHRVPARLPTAVALVNPHRPDAEYPDRGLTGAGVAFTLARLLLGADALDLADLAAIGTVADVAPILGENRAIARLGLERIRTAPRPGIAGLLAAAAIAPAACDLETLAFAVAPRLNAAGRVGEASDAARLLLTDDADEAAALAEALQAANGLRRDLTRSAIAEARISPDAVDEARATIVHGAWAVGIVGLVASRLAEERGRPAIVGADLGPVIRASARSDGRLHLADALAACGDLLVRHGGHAGAAGFEIEADRWLDFRDRFLTLAGSIPPADPVPTLALDLAVPALDVGYDLLRELGRLAPAGVGNPEPLVAILGLTVVRAREASGGHSQLVLRRDRDVLDGIAFGWPELAGLVYEGDRIDVVARLASRRFGGIESLQLELRDAAPAGSQRPAARPPVAVAVAPGPGPAPLPAPVTEPIGLPASGS